MPESENLLIDTSWLHDGFDITPAARMAAGFRCPVLVTRAVFEALIWEWSRCACDNCEKIARNLMWDRQVRIARNLRDAVVALSAPSAEVRFAMDQRCGRWDAAAPSRKYVALRATPADGPDPAIVISLESQGNSVPLLDGDAARQLSRTES